jgi:hypothetical protein
MVTHQLRTLTKGDAPDAAAIAEGDEDEDGEDDDDEDDDDDDGADDDEQPDIAVGEAGAQGDATTSAGAAK